MTQVCSDPGKSMRHVATVLFFLAFALTGGRPALADAGIIDRNSATLGSVQDADSIGFRNGSVIVAPIPFSNPTIGSGLVLGAGYLFSIDPGSKPSVIGIAGLRSDNGSMAGGAAINLFWNDNRWQLNLLYARADVNYDLFTSLATIPINQTGDLARAKLAYGVTPELSFGASIRYLDTIISPEVPGLPPIPPPFDQFLRTKYINYGLTSDWDKRDNSIYPTSGFYLQAEAFRGVAIEGILADYSKAYVNATKYFPIHENGVLVGRFSLCGSSDSAPFFDQCSLGGSDKFRGFSATEFLDLRSASAQIEYRHRFSKRLGAVAFGGVGKVGPNYSDFDVGSVQAAYGIGARYRVSKKFPLDFSVDVARNSQSDNTVYVYVGQRF